MKVDPPQDGSEVEAWREQVRQLPGVVVHRPQPPVPYVPDIQVLNVRHLDELIGEGGED